MYIQQELLNQLLSFQWNNKVLVFYGPRRVGKTTLLQHFLEQCKNYLFVSGDDKDTHDYLSSESLTKLTPFVAGYEWLIVDEAQKIPKIGSNLKLLVDHFPDLKIIVTGSSAFDLANSVGEPLTGRRVTWQVFPLSQLELQPYETLQKTKGNLAQRLIYGSYPEVILKEKLVDKRAYLQELTNDYLYKDILLLDGIRKSQKLKKLLQLLAFQIGKEVSLPELGTQLGLSKDTVAHYIDLLEKSFVLLPLTGFSRNPRKEISKSLRYYFYDLGVRNALIEQFNALESRSDVGELWENYLVVERIKNQQYRHFYVQNFFWRTYSQQEIDWVEVADGEITGYEFKWNPKAKPKIPPQWKLLYPDAKFQTIHPDNYLEFITEKLENKN
jgi:predicted AAA+ superfamily ATPase